MRDPERIQEFCDRLALAWSKLPDWRFFQLISNLPFKADPFYMEDEQAIHFIEEAVNDWTRKKDENG